MSVLNAFYATGVDEDVSTISHWCDDSNRQGAGCSETLCVIGGSLISVMHRLGMVFEQEFPFLKNSCFSIK